MSTDSKHADTLLTTSSKQQMKRERDETVRALRSLVMQIDALEYVEFSREYQAAEYWWDNAVNSARALLARLEGGK